MEGQIQPEESPEGQNRPWALGEGDGAEGREKSQLKQIICNLHQQLLLAVGASWVPKLLAHFSGQEVDLAKRASAESSDVQSPSQLRQSPIRPQNPTAPILTPQLEMGKLVKRHQPGKGLTAKVPASLSPTEASQADPACPDTCLVTPALRTILLQVRYLRPCRATKLGCFPAWKNKSVCVRQGSLCPRQLPSKPSSRQR